MSGECRELNFPGQCCTIESSAYRCLSLTHELPLPPAQVVCDPETRRPYIMLRYCFSTRSKPMQELLLDYEWDSYWCEARNCLCMGVLWVLLLVAVPAHLMSSGSCSSPCLVQARCSGALAGLP